MDEAFAVIMAFSRLYAGVHYPTDVVSGIIVAFVGGCLTWHLRSTIFDRK
ncbi:PAP2 superfamily protein [Selenomonas ruminantium]|uniref:PAP2 superfamily protein n=1 Tax=Selenomonas ruminantium TaxID=971 RepID=A0A1I3GJ57_SELRU|nr:phosphatase PAP2 family protein [Selenomonas ruminantium]SFI23191.1 PAP2 superfamily protein [Selenomonas ruminantium]